MTRAMPHRSQRSPADARKTGRGVSRAAVRKRIAPGAGVAATCRTGKSAFDS